MNAPLSAHTSKEETQDTKKKLFQDVHIESIGKRINNVPICLVRMRTVVDHKKEEYGKRLKMNLSFFLCFAVLTDACHKAAAMGVHFTGVVLQQKKF